MISYIKNYFYDWIAARTIWNELLQTELREVFEGSCKLIPIKIIANECIKLADEFVVELVETLSSEMNPDTVCAVAGITTTLP